MTKPRYRLRADARSRRRPWIGAVIFAATAALLATAVLYRDSVGRPGGQVDSHQMIGDEGSPAAFRPPVRLGTATGRGSVHRTGARNAHVAHPGKRAVSETSRRPAVTAIVTTVPPTPVPPPTTRPTVAPPTTTTVLPHRPLVAGCVIDGPTRDTCGPYSDPGLAWSNGSNTYAGPDAWACGSNNCGPTSGTTFTATSAENFSITTNQPAGNSGVLMFPSAVVYPPDPVLSTLHSLTSGYSESMPINSGTTGWSAYDIFMNSGQEVMIQTEQEHACIPCSATLGTTTISGIPMTVLQYGGKGGEIIFVPTTTATGTTSGTMDLLGAFNWLIAHGYLSSSDSLGLISFGHEICSTGGVPETWTVSTFTVNES